MASYQVTVSSAHHHNDLVAGLWSLLLEKRGVDVQVGWGGRYVPAHGLLLDAFQLSQYKLSAAQRQLRTNDCRTLEALLEFAYTGRVTVAGDELYVLLAMAQAVDFRLLVDALQEVVQRHGETTVKVEPDTDDVTVEPILKSLLTGERKNEFLEDSVTEPTTDLVENPAPVIAVLVKEERASQSDDEVGLVKQEFVQPTPTVIEPTVSPYETNETGSVDRDELVIQAGAFGNRRDRAEQAEQGVSDRDRPVASEYWVPQLTPIDMQFLVVTPPVDPAIQSDPAIRLSGSAIRQSGPAIRKSNSAIRKGYRIRQGNPPIRQGHPSIRQNHPSIRQSRPAIRPNDEESPAGPHIDDLGLQQISQQLDLQFERIRAETELQYPPGLPHKSRTVKRPHLPPSAAPTPASTSVGRNSLNEAEQTSRMEHRSNTAGRSNQEALRSVPTYDISSDDDEQTTGEVVASGGVVMSNSGPVTNDRSLDFVCTVCNKAFAVLEHLMMHRRSHVRRPHKCTWCQKSFTRRSVLTDHLRTHTLEKPYRCRFCDKGFAKRWNALEHELIHSGVRRRSRGQTKESIS